MSEVGLFGVIKKDFADVTISRHRGAETSIEANAKAKPSKAYWRLQCLGVISQMRQATLDDICQRLKRPANALSGRITELLANEQIEVCGKRDGFRLYRVI